MGSAFLQALAVTVLGCCLMTPVKAWGEGFRILDHGAAATGQGAAFAAQAEELLGGPPVVGAGGDHPAGGGVGDGDGQVGGERGQGPVGGHMGADEFAPDEGLGPGLGGDLGRAGGGDEGGLGVKAAEEEGMTDLKGHRSVGGIRASIYNATPVAGVERLRDFMVTFKDKNAK